MRSSLIKTVRGAAKDTSLHKKIFRKELLLRTNKKEVSLGASITVEASLALPLFIFFFVNIMTLFNIVKVQSDMEAALHQAGSEITIRAFDLRFGESSISGETGGNGALEALAGGGAVMYASGMVRDYLGSGIDKSCVTGGFGGISFLPSKVMLGDDIVDIVADYTVHPVFPIIGFSEFPVEARFYGHAWTGYDIANGLGASEDEEEMVYVTEYGEVFHRNINCSHLKLSVRSVDLDTTGNLRNMDGGKYYPCEYCAQGVTAGNVFITNYGDRYHTSVGCSGLKRKIYTIPISEAGGRPPCKTCG